MTNLAQILEDREHLETVLVRPGMPAAGDLARTMLARINRQHPREECRACSDQPAKAPHICHFDRSSCNCCTECEQLCRENT